jgi:hypothetical protein
MVKCVTVCMLTMNFENVSSKHEIQTLMYPFIPLAQDIYDLIKSRKNLTFCTLGYVLTEPKERNPF